MSENTEITEKKLPNPQKFKWKNVAYYKTYAEAAAHRKTFDDSINVKIRRCGPDKTKFVVRTGTPIKGASSE
tara:strand:+ start:181 stop:396 length:216 start_codon:yes stop_codon:yes gene_type:complete